MTNFSQKNHQLVLVGKDVALEDTTKTIASMNDGQIGIWNPGGVRIIQTGGSVAGNEIVAATGDRFQIMLDRGALEPLRSPIFSKDDVLRVTRKTYAAPAVQLDYIGSNGTTGSIAVQNSTVYRATIALKDSPDGTHGSALIKDMVYSSDASATQEEIARGLANSGYGNFSREAEEPIVFKAVCDNAGAAMGTAVGTMYWNKGSKIVKCSDADDATANAAVAVGDFLRVGTTVTSDMYKITAIDTTDNFFTIEYPFRGASTSADESSYEVVTAALGASANWGVALTGQALAFTVGKINNKVASWKLSLNSDSFTTTTITGFATTVASLGTGTNNQVAELEYFCNGNNGEFFRDAGKNTFPFTSMVVSGETYDSIEILLDQGRTDSLGSYKGSPSVITMFIDSGKDTGGHYALTATDDDITDVLEELLTGVPVYGGAVTSNGGAMAAGDLAIT